MARSEGSVAEAPVARAQAWRGPIVAALLVLVITGCAHPALLPPKAIALNREGAQALAAGDLELAEARVALALEYNPRFTEAWVNLGLIEMERGDIERARHDFLKARELNPDLPAPHHALGLLSEREGHPEESERRYRAALKVDPGFAPARINLARILFDRGDSEEAREQFLRLTQVAPEFAEGWTGLCESLLRLGRVNEVDDVIARARRRFGRLNELDILEARGLLRAGEFGEAERRLEPLANELDPKQAGRAAAWLAIARLASGKLSGAEKAAELASSLDPDDHVAAYAVAAVRDARARAGK
jgi:tetratricopeptide (TPR) repeat protein